MHVVDEHRASRDRKVWCVHGRRRPCSRFVGAAYRRVDRPSPRRRDRVRDRRASRRYWSRIAPRDERPPRRSDCVGLQVVVIVVGWFSAALDWLVRRPGKSARSLPSRASASGRPCRDRAFGREPVAAPQHRCVGRFGSSFSRVVRRPRVPGGSYCESLRVGAARRVSARTTGVLRPLLLYSPVGFWQCSVCRLQRLDKHGRPRCVRSDAIAADPVGDE